MKILKAHKSIIKNMDVTEQYRSTEDITKTDFFDFITAPENQSNYQTFAKQMRNVNVFFEDDTLNNNVKQETNNNIMLDTQTIPALEPSPSSNYDNTYWNNNDKETVKLETAILDDLNKYCNWNQQDTGISPGISSSELVSDNKAATNTDGHIYTLTILNGVDQSNWYRPQLEDSGSREDDPSNLNIEQIAQQSLDIESILNIMPQSFSSSFDNLNTSSSQENLTTDGLIKSEYPYDDSNFDTKELIIGTPLLEPLDLNDNYANNNNDWKVENNNTSSADSLLRSALQGKSILRYNGQIKKPQHITLQRDDDKQLQHTELHKVLASPPSREQHGSESNNNSMMSVINNNNVLLFNNNEVQLSLSENTAPQSTMEEILLSQLESGTYPEDFEKLKQIATEVAESVYYQLEPVDSNIYIAGDLSPSGIVVQSAGQASVSTTSNLSNTSVLNQQQNLTNVVTSTKPAKKYKRSNSNVTKQQASTSISNITTIQTATSTSNGIRKERSLHYCGICSKGFKDKYSVNVHIRTHTGEKPFACSLCGKSFRQKAHLAKHYQTHIAQKNAAANAAGGSKKGGNHSNHGGSGNPSTITSPNSNQLLMNNNSNNSSSCGSLVNAGNDINKLEHSNSLKPNNRKGTFTQNKANNTNHKTESTNNNSNNNFPSSTKFNEQFTTNCDSTRSVMSNNPMNKGHIMTQVKMEVEMGDGSTKYPDIKMEFDESSSSTSLMNDDSIFYGNKPTNKNSAEAINKIPISTITSAMTSNSANITSVSNSSNHFPVVLRATESKNSIQIISNNVISSSSANVRTSPTSSTTS